MGVRLSGVAGIAGVTAAISGVRLWNDGSVANANAAKRRAVDRRRAVGARRCSNPVACVESARGVEEPDVIAVVESGVTGPKRHRRRRSKRLLVTATPVGEEAVRGRLAAHEEKRCQHH